MSDAGRFPALAMLGSAATGRPKGIVINGWRGDGTVRPMRGPVGTAPAMHTSGKAGSYEKATGTTTITDRGTTTSWNQDRNYSDCFRGDFTEVPRLRASRLAGKGDEGGKTNG